MKLMKPVKLIAEIGSVHDGSFGNAVKLIDAAAACGAHAVKFQTHIAAAETLRNAPNPPYFKGEPRFEYFTRTGFSLPQWKELAAACARAKVEFLSSPFSLEAVDLLEEVGVGSYKIPSGEVTNIPLLKKVATTKKPVLLSSGMSDWAELDAAVAALRGGGAVTVLQCSSAYPCPPEQVGLNVMVEMRDRYKLDVGFSDHTLGVAAAISAATLGATVIEKHFTFSRAMYGSDAANGTEPGEFKLLADALAAVAVMREKNVDKNDTSAYRDMKRIFEKSVVAARDLPAGHVLAEADLAYKKPGDGIPASRYQELVGRKLKRAVTGDHQFAAGDLS
jgi:N,N'-diacetyllegionaminate synthase